MKSDTEFICPNPHCDYHGKPEFESYGSFILAILLILCGIVPGIFYISLCMGTKYYCPKCKIIMDKE